MSSRDEILALLRGDRLARLPVFSGLPSLTASGLEAAGVRYNDAHTDATRMAVAAASTCERFGWESAVVPFDLCVEAEALGCHIDFQTDVDLRLPPVVDGPLADFLQSVPQDISLAGRVPLVADALRQLHTRLGHKIAIGAWVPGPFTLAWLLFGADGWIPRMPDTARSMPLLAQLAEWLARVGNFYRAAGADFITVHEMGGSPQVVGVQNFRTLVKPNLARLFSGLPSPKVLSICGDTNAVIDDLGSFGADALNVDQRTDLALLRRRLPHAVVLGNIDPVGILSRGTPDTVRRSAQQAREAGVNAIWPGCDLVPDTPDANMFALMDTEGSSNDRPPLT